MKRVSVVILVAIAVIATIVIFIFLNRPKPKPKNEEVSASIEVTSTELNDEDIRDKAHELYEEQKAKSSEEPSEVRELRSIEAPYEGTTNWEQTMNVHYTFEPINTSEELTLQSVKALVEGALQRKGLEASTIDVYTAEEAKEFDVLSLCGEHYIEQMKYYVEIGMSNDDIKSCVITQSNVFISDF